MTGGPDLAHAHVRPQAGAAGAGRAVGGRRSDLLARTCPHPPGRGRGARPPSRRSAGSWRSTAGTRRGRGASVSEVASVAAGVLAAQGGLAARIAEAAGRRVEPVETSVLQAGLLLMSHYVAAPPPGRAGPHRARAPRPGRRSAPRTAAGSRSRCSTRGVEGVLGPLARGAERDRPTSGRAWTSFRGRYYRGDCSFPPGLHEATSAAHLAEAADGRRGSAREPLRRSATTTRFGPSPVGTPARTDLRRRRFWRQRHGHGIRPWSRTRTVGTRPAPGRDAGGGGHQPHAGPVRRACCCGCSAPTW